MVANETWKNIPGEIRGMVDRVRDILSVERVVGNPIERDGVTLVPVVAIRGGGGGGGGEGEGTSSEATSQEGAGGGLGFGVTARPVGAYVIHGETVEWKPAVDPARMALIMTVMAFLITRTLRALISD